MRVSKNTKSLHSFYLTLLTAVEDLGLAVWTLPTSFNIKTSFAESAQRIHGVGQHSRGGGCHRAPCWSREGIRSIYYQLMGALCCHTHLLPGFYFASHTLCWAVMNEIVSVVIDGLSLADIVAYDNCLCWAVMNETRLISIVSKPIFIVVVVFVIDVVFVKKCFKKIHVQKNFRQKFLSQKELGPKKLWSKKMLSKKLRFKNFWVQTNFGYKNFE